MPGDILAYDAHDREVPVEVPRHSAAGRIRVTRRGRTTRGARRATCRRGRRCRPTPSAASSTSRPTAPRIDYYGGFRPGNNLFAASLIALDVKTGKRVWHYQMVQHDIWNYDTPTAPIVMDVNVGGRRIPGVFQATKQAFLYAFNRQTGEPIWGFEERPVPRVEGAGREAVADAAVPDQAGAVRVHRPQRRAPDRLHAARSRSSRCKRATEQGLLAPPFNPPDASRQRGRRGDRRASIRAKPAARTSRIRRRPIRRRASSTFRRTAAAARARWCPASELDCFGQTGTTVTAWVPTSAGCTAGVGRGGHRDVSGRGAEGRRQSRAAAGAVAAAAMTTAGGGGGRGGAGGARRRGASDPLGGLPTLQGTGRPHHGDRPEHRRASVGDPVRRCAAGSSRTRSGTTRC